MEHDSAYVAAPAGRARATIAVLHPWWGLTPVMTGVCDDLAELGYVAVAPDLYGGDLASTAAEATALRGRKRTQPMWRQIVANVEHVRSQFGGGSGSAGWVFDGWALGLTAGQVGSP